jgi:hypothetical protein
MPHAEHLLANRSVAELSTSCVVDFVGQTVEMLVLFGWGFTSTKLTFSPTSPGHLPG